MSRRYHPARSITGAIPREFVNHDPLPQSITGEAPHFLLNRKLTRAERLALKSGKLRSALEAGHLRELFAAGPDGSHCAHSDGQPDNSLPGVNASASTEENRHE
ncbi:hypothetical protein M2318_003928 [Metapseudomonas resinovorans]|uniref:hypothetical protein n=1 Tax=Metapseudomonas resinovorans TaxID=53412 RepID=UPI003D218795